MPGFPKLRSAGDGTAPPSVGVAATIVFWSRLMAFVACLLEAARVEAQLHRLPPVEDQWSLPDGDDQHSLRPVGSTAETGLATAFASPTARQDAAPRDSRRGESASPSQWHEQWFPDGLVYRSYLGSDREPRFACVWTYERDQGWLWDVTLGGRVGLWRWGDSHGAWPDGWQVDMEGAAMPRLDPLGPSTPLLSSDFRFGIPITYGEGPFRFKTGYYHLSSHLGDEFMLLHPEVERSNYSRDAIIMAVSYYFGDQYAWRAYGEVTWADWAGSRGGVAKPWEFLVGFEYSPAFSFDRGRPFWAVHSHLREESNFGGHFSCQAGWQLPRGRSGQLFRFGAEYVNGKSTQASFFREHESRLGLGMWYDF